MTNARTIRIRLAAAAMGAAALLIPVTITPGDAAPVTITEACADNTCCAERGSFCNVDGEIRVDMYAADSCKKVEEE